MLEAAPSSNLSGHDETARLRALASSGLGPDCLTAELRALLQLARATFDVPTVLLSAVAESTQIFLARAGASEVRTSRAASFCAHTLEGPGLLVVPDARQDARFRDTELVAGAPHVRFYGGARVSLRSGHAVGAFCLVDARPRQPLPRAGEERLKEFAALAELMLRLHVMHTAAPEAAAA